MTEKSIKRRRNNMKIDVSQITGYSEMSAEEKVKALESFAIPDADYTGYVKKDVFDKTASELASTKKDLKARMTAEEQANADIQATIDGLKTTNADLEKQLADMKHINLVAQNKAQLLGTEGYDDKTADLMANALANGDLASVLKIQKSVIENVKKTAIGNAMANAPVPDAGKTTKTITTKAEFLSATTEEQTKFKNEHPNWMSELK